MSDKLRNLLHRGADEARIVSMETEVFSAGRRLRRARGVLTGSAAAVTAIALFGGFVLLKPAPTPDETADTASGALDWQQIPETLYFATGYEGVPGAASLTGDELDSVELAFASDTDGTFAISPDGQAWSKVDGSGVEIGKLVHDGELSGDQPAFARLDDPNICGPHTWSPDASQLIVGRCDGDQVSLLVLDAVTAQVVATIESPDGLDSEIMRTPYVSALWTADGEHLVWGDNDDGFTIADPDGTDREPFDVRIPPDGKSELRPDGNELPFIGGISTVSPGGRYVGMSLGYSEGGRLPEYTPPVEDDVEDPQGPGPFHTNGWWSNYVYDTQAGAELELPIGEDDQLFGVVFSSTGQMMVHFSPHSEFESEPSNPGISLFSPAGEELDNRVLPHEVSSGQLFSYR